MEVLPKTLNLVKTLELTAKHNIWLNMECMLLCYKFPKNDEVNNWLINALNEKPQEK